MLRDVQMRLLQSGVGLVRVVYEGLETLVRGVLVVKVVGSERRAAVSETWQAQTIDSLLCCWRQCLDCASILSVLYVKNILNQWKYRECRLDNSRGPLQHFRAQKR